MSDNFQKYGGLFQVDVEHFEEFFSLLKSITLGKSEFFLQQEEKCQYIGFVKNGTMRSFYNNENGNDISFIFHFHNQFFTDYESILCDKKSKLNIQAIHKSELLLLHKDDLQKLYNKEA
ncbi:Crp/Fnr family transcriptional regulator [Flavobacterium sp. GT3P67]|nr:cyclic nucleotide-binding domain-containing protein [Flavobacterium sp. GT3P67]